MFPADCLPTNYIEARAAKDKETAQKNKPTLLAPIPQRPAGPARTLSSTLLSFFPSASATQSAVSSARNSPSATPMPSPGLNGPKHSWFAPVPKPSEQDITCLPPAWS